MSTGRVPFSDYSHTNPRIRILSREQIRDAVARYERGDPVKVIAADLGVTPAAIYYHLNRRTVLHCNRTPSRRAS